MRDDAITITPARPEHEALIRAQSAQTNSAHHARLPHVFQAENGFQNGLLDAAFADDLTGADKVQGRVFVASNSDTPLGFALVIWTKPTDTREGCSALVADIATFDGARKQGVARALLTYLEAQMPVHGWESLTADVWHGNTASHALFHAAGFTPERVEYRLGTPSPAIDTPPNTEGVDRFNIWMGVAIALLLLLIIISSVL